MAVSAHVSLDVADLAVVFHCDQDNDRASYRIEHDGHNIDVYLDGTPEQLGRFADAIVHAVSQHTIRQHEQAITAALR